MDRRYTLTALVVVLLVAAAGFWWYQGHRRFVEFTLDEVRIAGEYYKARRFRGVASPDDPGALRACFRIDRPIEAPPALDARPRPGPDWFKCFDAEFLAEMLAAGEGRAYLAARDEPPGYDRMVVVLPGGRVYMWLEPNR